MSATFTLHHIQVSFVDNANGENTEFKNYTHSFYYTDFIFLNYVVYFQIPHILLFYPDLLNFMTFSVRQGERYL